MHYPKRDNRPRVGQFGTSLNVLLFAILSRFQNFFVNVFPILSQAKRNKREIHLFGVKSIGVRRIYS